MQPARKVREQAREQQKPALEQVIARIREDARREPERYLRDAEVPAGGE